MMKIAAFLYDSLLVSSAVVKTALKDTKKALRREQNNYLIRAIRSSPYIRTQYNIIERDVDEGGSPPQVDFTATAPPGMVFEWM